MIVQKHRGSVRSRQKLPRPASPSQVAIWERDVPGFGRVFCNGAIERKGQTSYLIRRSRTGTENSTAVVLLGTNGKIREWYSDWKERATPALKEAIREAGNFVVVKSVMDS